MTSSFDDFIFHKNKQITPVSEFTAAVATLLADCSTSDESKEPNAIYVVPKPQGSVECQSSSGHYFMGGLPALMQAVRLLQEDPSAKVTYVNDGQLKKSTHSAHQGHVHPTEWTTPELSSLQLTKILLGSFHVIKPAPPEDVFNYSYIHFPASKLKVSLLIRNMAFKVVHMLLSKNGVSEDDLWQCEAVRSSIAFHKALSDEIEATGNEPTFALSWRLIWSPDKEGIDKKRKLWSELGIQTEYLSPDELRVNTLLRDDVPLYGLKVLGDGKFFPNTDQKITAHLSKKYPNTFNVRTAAVSELYVDEATNAPFAVKETLPDGTCQTVAVDSFYGSTGHNQVFKKPQKKPLWDEVAVTGVSSLWVCSVARSEIVSRFAEPQMSDENIKERLKQFVGGANLTNMHTTIWDVAIENNTVHMIVRITQGANFNSELADPNDLHNITANISRFLIGSWKLVSAGSCTRKTATSNVPLLKEHFVHGLSGIGYSFSAAPKEMLNRPLLTDNLTKKLFERFVALFRSSKD